MADRARTYHRLQLALWLAGLALTLGYLGALLATGAGPALRAWAETWARAWWLQLPLIAGVVAGGRLLLALPLTWLGGFWLPRRYGLLHQPLAAWLRDAAKAGALGAVLSLGAAGVVYALLRSTRWWWLASAGALVAASAWLTWIAPVWLLPLFFRLTPLDDAALRARLVALAGRAGLDVLGVWVADQSRRGRTANAAVTGLAGTRRIVLFDTLVAGFPAEEVESVLAHELGHHAHRDIGRGLLVQGVLAVGSLAVADVLLRAGVRWLSLDGPGDLAGLPFVALVATVLGLLTMPLGNAWSRRMERQADDYALALIGRPEAFVAALERLGALNLAERDPHPVKEWLLHSHPSIGRRVARARRGLPLADAVG
jgi:STE24 endopeptidase